LTDQLGKQIKSFLSVRANRNRHTYLHFLLLNKYCLTFSLFDRLPQNLIFINGELNIIRW